MVLQSTLPISSLIDRMAYRSAQRAWVCTWTIRPNAWSSNMLETDLSHILRGRQSLGFALTLVLRFLQQTTCWNLLEGLLAPGKAQKRHNLGRGWKEDTCIWYVCDVTVLWPLVEAVSGCRATATWVKPTVSWQAQKQAVYPSKDSSRLCCLRTGKQKSPCYRQPQR